MTQNLIDLERAKRGIQSITDDSQDALLGVLIAAASDAVQKYCRRDFSVRSYDETYNGDGAAGSSSANTRSRPSRPSATATSPSSSSPTPTPPSTSRPASRSPPPASSSPAPPPASSSTTPR
jgi:hypothetical protein